MVIVGPRSGSFALVWALEGLGEMVVEADPQLSGGRSNSTGRGRLLLACASTKGARIAHSRTVTVSLTTLWDTNIYNVMKSVHGDG